VIWLAAQGNASGTAENEAEILERDCLREAADVLQIQADRLPEDSLWRLWLTGLGSGLERNEVDDPTADLLTSTTKANGQLLVLAADMSKQEPGSPMAREIQAIAQDLQEVRVIHPAARLLLEARARALSDVGEARNSSSVGAITRERLRIQGDLEKYKLNPPDSEEEKIEYEDAITAEGELHHQAFVSIAKGEVDGVLVARALLGDEAVA